MTTKIPVELSSTPGIVDGSNATAITIDSSENVGIGTSSPSMELDVRNDGSGGIAEIGVRGGASGAGSVQISGHGTTYGSTSFDLIQNSSAAYAYQRANLPLIFGTNNTERMRILAAGGLTFNGDTAAANALDDYEEGTWTATLSSSSGGFAASATSFTNGQYNKIGNLVTAHIYTGSFNITNAGSGYAKVSGLPYTSRSGSYDYGSVIFYHTNCFQVACPTGYVAGGADFTIASRGDQANVGGQAWKTGTTLYLMLQVQYQAA